MIKVFVASDHAGIELKSRIVQELSKPTSGSQLDVHDFGPFSTDSVDYPDFADLVCKKIHGFTVIDLDNAAKTHLTEIGILICGSGQGMAMRANKYPNIRAALCWNEEMVVLAREHNDANVLCLGARHTSEDAAVKMVHTFIKTLFTGGRHRNRVLKVNSPTS